MKKNLKKAFSLVELSIVLLIIGILIAGITQSSRLIRQYRISAAQSLTKNSPVTSINGLTFWFETVADESFNEASAEDQVQVEKWQEINPVSTNKVEASAKDVDRTTWPTYIADCIKSLPCLKFDGQNDYMMMFKRGLSFNRYTIFVVVDKLASSNSPGYVLSSFSSYGGGVIGIGDFGDSQDENQHAILYYITYNESPDDPLNTADPINISEAGPHIFEAYEKEEGGAFLINGVEKIVFDTSAVTDSKVRNIDGFSLAAFTNINGEPVAFFNGRIAEFIFFDRALKNEERQAVREYLTKKWK